MKKANYTRLLATVLVLVIAFGCFAGCGKTAEAPESKPVEEVSEAKENTSVAEKEESIALPDFPAVQTYEGAYEAKATELKQDLTHYGYEEPITLKVGKAYSNEFTWREGEDATNNVWSSLLSELGINQEIIFNVDDSQFATKMATSIVSGEYPDIIQCNMTQLQEYAASGVIADITDVFEEYATDELKNYIADTIDGSKYEGQLYGIARKVSTIGGPMMMFIRQDWLDNLGLEVPTTIEELKNVAKAFTENDPDGDGIDDTYGLGIAGKDGFTYWSGIQTFFECYGAAPGTFSGNFSFIEKDGKVVWGGELVDEMKAGLADLKEMYENGWLAKGFSTMDYVQLQSDIATDTCGIYFAPNWGSQTAQVDVWKNDINANIIAAPLPNGMGEGSAKTYSISSPGLFYAVSSKCEHPEALIKLMNTTVNVIEYPENDAQSKLFNASDGSDVYAYNIIKFYKIDGFEQLREFKDVVDSGILPDGAFGAVTTAANGTFLVKDAMANGTLEGLIKADDPDIINGAAQYEIYGPDGAMEVLIKYFDSGSINQGVYLAPATETMVNAYPILDKMALEIIVKIVCGDSVDSYDEFLASWYELGGTDVLKEVNDWYSLNK